MSAQDRQTLSLPSLRNLQAFIAVANALSIHQAAEQLNVTPSAVSHQIASLESWLGKKLFIRSGKGVQLTPTGEQYLREVSAAMSAIGRATDQIVKEKTMLCFACTLPPPSGCHGCCAVWADSAPNILISPSISPAPMRTYSSPEIISTLISVTVFRTGTPTG